MIFYLLTLFIGRIYSSDLDKFNFDGLASDTYYNESCTKGILYFNFRKTFLSPNTTTCETADCIAQLKMFQVQGCNCYGSLASESYQLLSNNEGIQFNYTYSYYQSFSIKLMCDTTESKTLEESGTGLVLTWKAPQGCPKNKKKGGLSFGSIMLIVLAVIIVLYFALGIPIMHYIFHKNGIEMIPFIFFWSSLPKLVWEGIRFIISPCCGKKDYEEIE